MAIKHTFVSAIPDGADATLVRPSNWNADHGIDDATITLAKIQNAVANDKLLGSGATGSGSPYTELTLGTNLSMSGTTLNASGSGTTLFSPPGLRLTLTSGVPVTTNDVTAAGTLYYTPYQSGVITYYTGSAWAQESIAEISLALTLTSGKNYDVFYLHGTGLVLSSAWTNDTTRADALGTQDGVQVLASDHTKLWIGTIRASGTNTTEMSILHGYVYNAYNRYRFQLHKVDTTNHNYSTAVWRPWNNDATMYADFVVGQISSIDVSLLVGLLSSAGGSSGMNAIGVDTTTGPEQPLIGLAAPYFVQFAGDQLARSVVAGYHRVIVLENATSGVSVTYFNFDLFLAFNS